MAAAHEAPATGPDRYRPELHGLRGVAIGLVMLYHVWSGRVSGGVDVFLFLSAFLLTGSFVRRAEAGRGLRPVAYWAKTFKRLLPPTVVVSLATLTAVITLLEPERWMPALTDAMGSVGQVENWVLIHRDVDYYAADVGGPSPFQHFWSLSIQGQIFLIWPVLIAVTVAGAQPGRIARSGSLWAGAGCSRSSCAACWWMCAGRFRDGSRCGRWARPRWCSSPVTLGIR